MPLRPVIVDPLRDRRWPALLASSPSASPFHHPAWLELLSGTYGYGIAAWAVEDEHRGLVGGLPFARVASWLTGRRIVSLPFSDVCPPLLAPGAGAEAEGALADAIRAKCGRTGLDVELRCGLPLHCEAASASDRHWHHVVPLERDVAAVERRFRKSQIRRGVNKAVRSGVTVRTATDAGALDAFYRLHVRTRRRQGVPTQPRRFIRGFAGLFDRGLGHVMLAEHEGTPIAAAVFLRAGHTLVYKYGASDRGHLDKRPNNLLFAEAIRSACAAGIERLDMGRTDRTNEGLRAFKLAWGAEERDLAYTRLPRRAAERSCGGIPAPARRVIAAGPPAVGRLVGEVLYRHYA